MASGPTDRRAASGSSAPTKAVRLAAFAFLGVLAAACGTSPTTGSSNPDVGIAAEPGTEITAAMASALLRVRSVMVYVTGTTPGALLTGSEQVFKSTDDGESTGSLSETTGSSTSRYVYSTIYLGRTCYLRDDQTTWESEGYPAALAGRLAAKWVRVAADTNYSYGDTSSGFDQCVPTTSNLPRASVPKSLLFGTDVGAFTKGGASSVDGQPAVSLVSTKYGTVWVATTGTYAGYPIEAVTTQSGATITSTFGDWNGLAEPVVPAGALPLSSVAGTHSTTSPLRTGEAL